MGVHCRYCKMRLVSSSSSLLLSVLSILVFSVARAERIQSISTHTDSCFSCGMLVETGYAAVKVCGSSDCCLTPSLNNDHINWIPGQTDVFFEDQILECENFDIGQPPFSIVLYHDGTDALTLSYIEVRTDARTVRCSDLKKVDDHSYIRSGCQ